MSERDKIYLSDKEKQEIVRLLEEGRPLPAIGPVNHPVSRLFAEEVIAKIRTFV